MRKIADRPQTRYLTTEQISKANGQHGHCAKRDLTKTQLLWRYSGIPEAGHRTNSQDHHGHQRESRRQAVVY